MNIEILDFKDFFANIEVIGQGVSNLSLALVESMANKNHIEHSGKGKLLRRFPMLMEFQSNAHCIHLVAVLLKISRMYQIMV